VVRKLTRVKSLRGEGVGHGGVGKEASTTGLAQTESPHIVAEPLASATRKGDDADGEVGWRGVGLHTPRLAPGLNKVFHEAAIATALGNVTASSGLAQRGFSAEVALEDVIFALIPSKMGKEAARGGGTRGEGAN
jgi:hypothetical protein